MKKAAFTKYLSTHGCGLKRQGKKHEIWENPQKNITSAVPHHSELKDRLCSKICKDLGIPPIN